MTHVLQALYTTTLQKIEIARDLPNQREDLILKILASTTRALALYTLQMPSLREDKIKQKLIDLLSKEALNLPRVTSQSVSTYALKIDAFFMKTQTESSLNALQKEIEILDTYDVYAYTSSEIESLVFQKQRIILISSIFKFCQEIQQLNQKAQPRQREVQDLRSKSQEILQKAEKLNLRGRIKVLNQALEQLETLDQIGKQPRQIPKTPLSSTSDRESNNIYYLIFTLVVALYTAFRGPKPEAPKN